LSSVRIKTIEDSGELYLCRNDLTRYLDRWIAELPDGASKEILKVVRNLFEEFVLEGKVR
jgi:hypothetical protein